MKPDDLWAITAYFNPSGYSSRYSNFRVFRERLGVKLLAVELVYGRVPTLDERDADRLIQLPGKDVLWQKERLLNVALDALPPSCRFVAWLDCDVIFQDPRWAEAARDTLREARLLQPYSRVIDLGPHESPGDLRGGAVLLERESMASKYCRGAIVPGAISSSMLGEHSPGHAWVARRDLLEEDGFYDAMIVGSGDLAMAMATVGRYQDIEVPFQMNPRQAEHYSDWAVRFHRAIDGDLAVVEGTLLHLWHGDLGDRGYDVRYQGLKAHDFDPFSDIAVDQCGCWRWNSDKPELHAYVREYFERRREDG